MTAAPKTTSKTASKKTSAPKTAAGKTTKSTAAKTTANKTTANKTTANKTTANKTTANKTTATRAAKVTARRPAAQASAPKTATDQTISGNRLASIVAQLKESLAEARDVIQTTGEIMDDHRREIALTLLENVQENTDETFASLEDMVNAESLSDGLKISRDTLRSGIERNVRQVKDFADIARDAGRESAEPVIGYMSSLRGKFRPELDV